MQIGSVGSMVGAMTVAKRPVSRQDVPSATALGVGDARISSFARVLSEGGGNVESSAREVMARYDLRKISYTDLVAMADELRGVGALREEDYLDFIGPSPEHASLTGEAVANWNAPADYVAMREQQVAFLRSSGAESRFIAFASYHLSLYRYFDSLHST